MSANFVPVSHAVLIEPPLAAQLQPLMVRRSLAMLPVAGKPIIQLWLEHINLMGFTSVSIGVRDFPQALRNLVGDGSRWGLSIQIHALTDTMTTEGAVRHIGMNGPQLVASLNAIPTQNLSFLLSRLTHQDPAEHALLNNETAEQPLVYLSKDTSGESTVATSNSAARLPLANHLFLTIDSVKSLWTVNEALLKREIFDPLHAGFEVDPGIFMETGVQVKPGVNIQGPVKVGQNSYIGKNVKIRKNVVIGAGVIIESGCELENTVLLDNTHVGAESNLSNVIIDGASVYSLQGDTFTWINDPSILGWTNAAEARVSPLERLTAVCLLLAFMPALLAFALLQWARRRPVYHSHDGYVPDGVSITGQQKHQNLKLKTLTSLNDRFNKLPWLTEVIKGNLHLVGIGLPSSSNSTFPEWAYELQNRRPGVINLHDSHRTALAADTNYVEDLYYLNHRNRPRNLLILVRWVFQLCTARFSISNRKHEARL